ncbi:MAG: hypothetical protein IJ820_05465 [Lachnospiraceae bacterium]|nr:hypothetical protein [Lachnospiraceae bacterium]
MKRKLAAGLTAVFLSSVLLLQPAAAQELETETAPAQGTMETEGAGDVPAMEQIEVPETRPEYSALDYVKIEDSKYKEIEFSIYPPADDSEEAQTAWKTEVDTQIMTQLFGLYPIADYPEDLMNYVAGSLIATYQQYADMYGMDFAAFLQTYMKMDQNTFIRQVQAAAQQTLKEEMLLKAVAEKENITVSDEEYEKGCENYALQYGYDSADALKAAFDEPTIRVSLLMDKTFDYLEKTVKINLIIETETESESEMTEAETAAQAVSETAAG